MEGKNEEGRNRGGLGIGASWVFGGRWKRKKKKARRKELDKKKLNWERKIGISKICLGVRTGGGKKSDRKKKIQEMENRKTRKRMGKGKREGKKKL